MPGAEVRVNLSSTFPALRGAVGTAGDAEPRQYQGRDTAEKDVRREEMAVDEDAERRNW